MRSSNMKWIENIIHFLDATYWSARDGINFLLDAWLDLHWIRALAFTAGPFLIFFIIELVTKDPIWEATMGLTGVAAGGLWMYKLWKQ